MMSLLIQLSMLIATSYSYALSSVTLESPASLYDGAHWITHYDSNTNNIWLLGGHYIAGNDWYITRYVQTYNIKTDTWTEHPLLADFVPSYVGSYTSIGNMIYFIAYKAFTSYSIDTHELVHPHPSSLINAVDEACVTNDERYIYVMGGWSAGYAAHFQIYDTTNNNWFAGLDLNIPRARSNCEYHNGYIYIFGGQIDGHGHTDSIEMVHVGIGDAVRSTGAFQAWTTLPAVLSSPMRDLSTVMCADVDTDVIYIFGGYDYASPNTHTVDSNIQIFDTTDESIRTASQLNTARAASSVVCIEDYIYVLLGYSPSGNSIDTVFSWEKSNVLYTSAPTSLPTTVPTTNVPTQGPITNAPTTNAPTTNAPTTNDPTQTGTISPTKTATDSPTQIVTVSPTQTVTVSPTQTVTVSPTQTVTVSPTKTPTDSPTKVPTNAPITVSPSITPSSAPITNSPTKTPTGTPTRTPTDTPKSPRLQTMIASFSCSYLQMFVEIADSFITDIRPLMLDCAGIFSLETMIVLGSDATCSWSDAHTLTVTLAPSSTLVVTDSIVIQYGAFEYMGSGSQSYTINEQITIDQIDNECDIAPIITIETPDVIGICDDLLLDIRGNVHHLGGRSPKSIMWTTLLDETNAHIVTDVYYVVVPMTPGSAVDYTVTVTAWYGASTTLRGTVSKSNTPIPSIKLLSPSVFGSHSSQIAIQSVIAFIDSCLSDSNDISLTYSWRMSHSSEETETLDTTRSNDLNGLLMGSAESALMIDAEQYLQKGFNYEFTLDTECSGYYVCSVSESVTISYEYSAIKCQISGGNKVLTIPVSDVPQSIALDGSSWSYDPDGNPLSASWSCIESDTTDCSSLFASLNALKTSFIPPTQTYVTDTEYLYQFTLRIADANVESRAPCTDTITLQLNIVTDESDIEALLISLSATSTTVHLDDKLRLIGDVTHLNGDRIDDAAYDVFYEWRTVDDALSVSDIKQFQTNAENTKYLVLGANTLSEGTHYEFVLSVYSDDSKAVLLGSASIDIYTKSGPIILAFDPVCRHTFDHFIDSLFYGFDLHITADGDYTPLSYAFNLQMEAHNTIYLHSYAQTVSHLLDVILPIQCKFSLISNVMDVQGTKTSQNVDCCITVSGASDDTDCFSYKTDVLNVYFATKNADDLLSEWQVNRYIFQTAFNVLHYLPNIHDKCRYSLFVEVIEVLSSYFSSAQSDFCITSKNYLFTIQLIQTLSKWLSIGLENDNFFADLLDDDYFALILDLWTQALDPCGVIRTVIVSTDDLSLSPQSVLSNRIIVFHDETDITNELSILLTNTDHFELLFASIDGFVEYLELYSSTDGVAMDEVVVFLQKVIYIAGLSSISRAIPTEFAHITWNNFELYSIRNDSSSVDITVNDIKITLNANEDHGGVKDVVIFGISSNPNAKYNSEIDCNDSNAELELQGELDGQEVSVTIVNASQSVNITMAFTHSFEDEDDDIACVWWNEMEQDWESSGCEAQIDKAKGVIVCHCTHLTTFATISHLHNDCLSDKLFNNQAVSFLMLIFAAAFGMIVVWIGYIIMTLKCVRNVTPLMRHPTVKITVFVACIAFLESAGCVLFYFYTDNKAYAITFSVLIMTPLILYYLMFTLIINSWINVAYATGDALKSIAYYQKILKVCAAVITVLFVVVFVLFFTMDHTLILVAEITWCAAMSLCVILLPYYGNRVIQLLTVYTIRQSDAHKRLKLMATQTRLKISIVTFCAFFIVQCALTIYFAVDKEALTISWTFFDLSIHLMCLYMICWLYRGKLYKLMTGRKGSKGSSKTIPSKKPMHVVLPSGLPSRTRMQMIQSESINKSEHVTPRAITPRFTSPSEDDARTSITRLTYDNMNINSLAAPIHTMASSTTMPTSPPSFYCMRVRSSTMGEEFDEAETNEPPYTYHENETANTMDNDS
eukprot:1071772_1